MNYRCNTDIVKTSNKISEAYSKLESMRIAISSLKKPSGQVSIKYSQVMDGNHIHKDIDPPERLTKHLHRTHSQVGTAKTNLNTHNLNVSHNIPIYTSFHNQSSNNLKMPIFNNTSTFSPKSTHQNLVDQYTSHINNTNITNEKLNFNIKSKDLNMSTSTIPNLKTIDNLEKEFDILKDEYEGTVVTNKILNKSNIEFKNQIKLLENQLDINENEILKCSEQNKIIEELRTSYYNLQNLQKDSNDLIQSLKQINNDLNNDNKNLKSTIDQIKASTLSNENEKEDLIKQIENHKYNYKNYQNDVFQLNQQILEKDRIILELNEQISSSSILNENLKKSLKDYEDMLTGLKKTIEIMKKSNNNNNATHQNLNKTISDQMEIIDSKNRELSVFEIKNNELINEIELLKKELIFLKESLGSNENDLNVNINLNRNQNFEIEKLKNKIESLGKIIEDKDNTISNIKNSMTMLNKNLEETNQIIESYKKMNNDGICSKSLIMKSSEKFEIANIDLKKKYDDLISLKENMVHRISSLESDLNEMKSKETKIIYERDSLVIKQNILTERLNEINQENSKLFDEKKNNEMIITQLENKFNEINNSYNQMYKNDLNLKNEVEALNSKLFLKDKTLESLIKSKEELNEEFLTLKDKYTKFSLDKSFKSNEDEDKLRELMINQMMNKNEIEKLSSELKSKEILIETLNNLISDLRVKQNEDAMRKDGEIVHFERTVEELKKQLNNSKDKESKIDIELEDTRNDLKYKSKMIDSMNNQINQLNESISGLKKEKEKLKLLLIENNKIIDENKQIINELQFKNEQDEKRYIESKINNEEFNAYCNDIINKCNKYQKEYFEMKNSHDKLSIQLKVLQDKHSDKAQNSINYNQSQINNSINESQNDISSIYVNDSKNKPNIINESDLNHDKLKCDESKEILFKGINPISERNEKVILSTSELNLKINQNSKKEKISIIQGNSLIFTIYDSKRLCKFDIEERNFKFIEFADFGDYEENFILEGSFCFNYNNNLLIITGQNHDLLYYYNHNKHSMSKLNQFINNHSSGSMILHNSTLLCLSGLFNKKVEKYQNNELFNKSNSIIDNYETNFIKELPDMNYERSSCPYVIIDNKFLYGIYGFNHPKNKCLDSVERINLEKESLWELIIIKSTQNSQSLFFGHSLFKKEDEVILFGGVNGSDNQPNKSIYILNLKTNSINEKLEIEGNSFICNKNCNSVIYQEKVFKKNFSIIYGDDLSIHNIQTDNFIYSTFKFEN